jgi:hypothetical protein
LFAALLEHFTKFVDNRIEIKVRTQNWNIRHENIARCIPKAKKRNKKSAYRQNDALLT